MSKRNIEKHILMNKAEAQDLQKKAKRACLSEGGLIRLLLKGYEPREKPDERFYDVMRELSAIGNNINQIAHIANAEQHISESKINEVLHLQNEIMRMVRSVR